MDKRVLITGGSRGIGAACVRKFALQGDRVVFVYHTHKAEAARISSETGAFAVCADLSKPEMCRDAVNKAAEFLGGIDILVNNAGISNFCLFTDITDGCWNEMLASNLGSAFACSREVSKLMIHEKYGRIINISSMWGICGASCEVHYSATKAGIIGMTKAIAKELGPSGITVNCIAPGVIDTDMNSALDEATMKELCDKTPLCRIGKPQEVASVVAFLAGEDADFITGQVISVDGGFAV